MNSAAQPQVQTVSENVLIASGSLDPTKEQTILHLPDGNTIRVATSMLRRNTPAIPDQTPVVEPETTGGMEPKVIPILEERLDVTRRTVVTGKVLLEKHQHEYQEVLDVPLALRTFDIERVVLNQPVETAPPVRQEGNTTVYSLVEEQLIVTTQLILKEELRVIQRDSERRDNRTVKLHRDVITVTRSSE